jgi:hypothetical protein
LPRGQRCELLARDRADIDDTRFDIGCQGERTERFGQTAFDETPVEIELEEPVAALQISLR